MKLRDPLGIVLASRTRVRMRETRPKLELSNPLELSGQTFADQLPEWNVRAKDRFRWG